MKTYIHKEKGFWELEDALPLSYNTGTIADYDNGAYVLLNNEQTAFHITHLYASQLECWNMKLIPEPDWMLDQAKQTKLEQITAYDGSEAVNSFLVNGVSAWLTPDVRSNYKNSIEAAEILGETAIIFTIAGFIVETPLQDAQIMLAKIQRYADRCMLVTETHKGYAKVLTTLKEVEAYDYTVGFPEKEVFNVTPVQDMGVLNNRKEEVV